MPLPNFICVGAQKAGTSTLFDVLKQSPQVFFPEKKELHFFEKPEQFAKGIEHYASHFEHGYSGQQLIGEITPEYLFYDYVPQRIKDTLGDIKVIILLRNPILRSYSQFNFHKMYQAEDLNADFVSDIQKEKLSENVNQYDTWCTPKYYLSKSLYYNQVKRYIDVFGEENVFVGIFEDLFQKDGVNLEPIFNFLGVTDFRFEKTHSNVSVINKSNSSFNTMSTIKRTVDRFVPRSLTNRLAASLKKQMTEKPKRIESDQWLSLNQKYFLADIKKTEELLNMDLSKWYKE